MRASVCLSYLMFGLVKVERGYRTLASVSYLKLEFCTTCFSCYVLLSKVNVFVSRVRLKVAMRAHLHWFVGAPNNVLPYRFSLLDCFKIPYPFYW